MIYFLLCNVWLVANKLLPCFTGLQALVPCVFKFYAADTPAVSKPRTTATATTHFARFLGDAAFGTYRADIRRQRHYMWALIKGSMRNTRSKLVSEHVSTIKYK